MAALLALGFWQLGQGAYIPAKAWLAQELMQRAWLRVSAGADRAAPWPWADTWPVARLSAKSHDVDLIVLAGGSGRTLAFGPGHLGASALPGETPRIAPDERLRRLAIRSGSVLRRYGEWAAS